jgi:hypothetical protein
MRILTALIVACCAGQAHADLINGNFQSGFSGWTSTTSLFGAGSWGAGPGTALPTQVGELSLNISNSTISMFQDFTLNALIPGQVTSANLSWDQYLDSGAGWSSVSPVQQFQVILSDSSSTSLVAFSTTSISPATIGPSTQSANQASLVAFLNQLGSNETVRLTFEAIESSFMTAEIDNISLNFTLAASAVPEPASFLLAAMAGAGSLVVVRRRRNSNGISA